MGLKDSIRKAALIGRMMATTATTEAHVNDGFENDSADRDQQSELSKVYYNALSGIMREDSNTDFEMTEDGGFVMKNGNVAYADPEHPGVLYEYGENGNRIGCIEFVQNENGQMELSYTDLMPHYTGPGYFITDDIDHTGKREDGDDDTDGYIDNDNGSPADNRSDDSYDHGNTSSDGPISSFSNVPIRYGDTSLDEDEAAYDGDNGENVGNSGAEDVSDPRGSEIDGNDTPANSDRYTDAEQNDGPVDTSTNINSSLALMDEDIAGLFTYMPDGFPENGTIVRDPEDPNHISVYTEDGQLWTEANFSTDSDGVLTAQTPEGDLYEQRINPDGTIDRAVTKDGEISEDPKIEHYDSEGNLSSWEILDSENNPGRKGRVDVDDNGNPVKREWDENGHLRYEEGIDSNGNPVKRKWLGDGHLYLEKVADGNGNTIQREWRRNGQLKLENVVNENGSHVTKRWDKNGQLRREDRTDENGYHVAKQWDENGQLQWELSGALGSEAEVKRYDENGNLITPDATEKEDPDQNPVEQKTSASEPDEQEQTTPSPTPPLENIKDILKELGKPYTPGSDSPSVVTNRVDHISHTISEEAQMPVINEALLKNQGR